MTEQNTIPAEKVRELADKYDQDSSGNPERLLVQAIADLRALLPAPPQPTTGLLGRWAKHPEHGDVVCVWDKPMEGRITVWYRNENSPTGSLYGLVPLDSLTFPEQITSPENVPEDQPWLVDVNAAHVTGSGMIGVRDSEGQWSVLHDGGEHEVCSDRNVTLIAPLTPERPGKDDLLWKYAILQQDYAHLEEGCNDLQARYDELDAKCREAQERIKELEQGSTPRTVTAAHDYATLPVRSVVAELRGETWEKTGVGLWSAPTQRREATNADLAGITRTVLRYGWGNEQPKPVWRIEHDAKNLRKGEYIIDIDGDGGTVTHRFHRGNWGTDGEAYGNPSYGPWVVFPSKDEAIYEAVEEAKSARYKETIE